MTTNQFENISKNIGLSKPQNTRLLLPSPLAIWENTKLKMDLRLTEYTAVSTEQADKMAAIEKKSRKVMKK